MGFNEAFFVSPADRIGGHADYLCCLVNGDQFIHEFMISITIA